MRAAFRRGDLTRGGKEVAATAAGGGESHGDATDAVPAGTAENSCRIGAGARKAADGTLHKDEVMVRWSGGGVGESALEWSATGTTGGSWVGREKKQSLRK